MNEAYKYRKTFHLPFSDGLQNDDRRLENEYCFNEKTVAVTIKMDGENTSMYRNGIHARSLYQMSHSSQHWIKAYHGMMRYSIPENYRVCGENLYARHSIIYNNLKSFFQVFNIWDENNRTLSFDDERRFCKENGFHTVEVVDILKIKGNDFSQIEKIYRQVIANNDEGIVIRNIEPFDYNDFQNNVAKAVRKNHVQTDIHWTKTWVPNKLENK